MTGTAVLLAPCDDTGPVGGCSRPPPAPPVRSVSLILRQDARSWTLGTADTDGGPVAWRVRLPGDLAPGRAELHVGDATTVLVVQG